MEDAIEKAARIIVREVGDRIERFPLVEPISMQAARQYARALAEAGLLAPAPLREEWAARYVNGGGAICRTRDEAEAELDRMTRDSHRHRVDEPPAPEIAGIYARYVTDWAEG